MPKGPPKSIQELEERAEREWLLERAHRCGALHRSESHAQGWIAMPIQDVPLDWEVLARPSAPAEAAEAVGEAMRRIAHIQGAPARRD